MTHKQNIAKTTNSTKEFTQAELRKTMELLFYAYRDFTGVAGDILDFHKLGRAHHRVIYFVCQYPNMTVSDLLFILKITKQSLNRVLAKLIKDGFILQLTDVLDKRKRLLSLTKKGIMLENIITNAQTDFIASAYLTLSSSEISGFEKTLLRMKTKSGSRKF